MKGLSFSRQMNHGSSENRTEIRGSLTSTAFYVGEEICRADSDLKF
jgi:hypothetical protein